MRNTCVPLTIRYNVTCMFFAFFFKVYGDHRDLHVLTHSFPTRRSSDLAPPAPTARGNARPTRSTAPLTLSEVEEGAPRPTALPPPPRPTRSEEHTSELQSLMRISYAVFCLKKKNKKITEHESNNPRDSKLNFKLYTLYQHTHV